MENYVNISTAYITLGQLMKETAVASTGGMVKMILAEYEVLVNDEPENRRGRKLYPGDRIEIEDAGIFVVNIEE